MTCKKLQVEAVFPLLHVTRCYILLHVTPCNCYTCYTTL